MRKAAFRMGVISIFLFLSFAPHSSADVVPLSRGLIGYWTFDGKDTIGSVTQLQTSQEVVIQEVF